MEIRLEDKNGITLISVEDLTYMLDHDAKILREQGKGEAADEFEKLIGFLMMCKKES